ncbi:MAG: hypothetical protein HY698_01585 [Deltaproteobacteria bacterium]|nr:hypothetical protein [Deltaproteobacteria bacterium]
MLKRVAVGQSRFATPFVALDSRGILLGRLGLLLFSSLDGVIGWLRLYSDEASLDDLIPELKILRVRTPEKSQAHLLLFPAASSHVLDRAARISKMSSGSLFTGTSRHFVAYRDERAPHGYDVDELPVAPDGGGGADFLLHALEGTLVYGRDSALDLRQIVTRLSLRRVPRSERLDAAGRSELVITVPQGISGGVIRTLWRSQVRAEAALVTPKKESALARDSGSDLFLFRVYDLPSRVLASFRQVPGISLFRPVLGHVGVEVGYEHPLELTSCASLFSPESFCLFCGPPRGMLEILGPVELSRVEHLAEVRVPVAPPSQVMSAQPAPGIGLDLRLVSSVAAPRKTNATLVSWREAPWLKKLVYALPPPMLRGHQVATCAHGILLLAKEGVDVVPLGQLLYELMPGILVPLGMEPVPRVSPEVLAQALGHEAGRLTIFAHGDTLFQVERATIVPLERGILASVDVPLSAHRDKAVVMSAEHPKIVNDPLGGFSLWGFPAPPSGGKTG